MLVMFSPIFAADTKVVFLYDFGASLMKLNNKYNKINKDFY